MAGGRPYSTARFLGIARYVGRTPLRAGRIALAVILWQSDFDAYAKLGRSITGATYVKARTPGGLCPPQGLLAAIRFGWRAGAIEHRLRAGGFRREDAVWLERQWRGRVPV